jgi:hypothetical protein
LLQSFLATLSLTFLSLSAAVHESEEGKRRFQALIENSSDAVATIDSESNVLYSSPATLKVLGYTPQEFLKLNGLSLVHPDDIELVRNTLKKVLEKPKEAITSELRVKHKSGSWKWIESVSTNLLEDPNIEAIVVNFRDITVRKEAEIMKSDFFWLTAHHLRTPLSNTKWNLESLLLSGSDQLPEETRVKILRIQKNNARLITQVNEILEIAKLQKYQFQDPTQTINVAGTIKEIINELESEAAAKEVEVNLNIAGAIPEIRIGPHHFREALHNLLTNAIKYNRPKGTITVSATNLTNEVQISVEDTGIGIPHEDRDKIFTRFYRATNVAGSDGTGLGLAIIKNYIDDWGGKIWFESKENAGTTFYFTIPLL